MSATRRTRHPNRAVRVLGRLSFLAALLVAAVLISVVTASATGALTPVAERLLASRLGPLGDGLELEGARVDLFGPAIVLEGLRIDDERGEPHLRLARVRATLSPGALAGRPLESIVVQGGSVVLSAELLDGLDPSNGDDPGEATPDDPGPDDEGGRRPSRRVRPPLVIVRDVTLNARDDDDVERWLGRVDLAVDEDAAGRRTLAGAVHRAGAGTVHLAGGDRSDGRFAVAATADQLPVALEELPWRGALADAGVHLLDGELTFRLDGLIDLDGEHPPHATLRASFANANLGGNLGAAGLVSDDELGTIPSLELASAGVGLEVEFAPAEGEDWRGLGAWSLLTHVDGLFGDTPMEAWVLAGDAAGVGDIARVWAHLPDANVEPDFLRGVGLWRVLRKEWKALEPRGRVALTAGLRVPIQVVPAPGVEAPPVQSDLVVDVEGDGRAGFTFRGWQNSGGEREGLPLPFDEARGRVAFGRLETLERPVLRRERLAVLGIELARPSGARMSARGMVCTPLEPGRADIDLQLRASGIPIDAALLEALGELDATAGIERDYAPEGGSLDADVRVVQLKTLEGLAASGRIDVHDTRLAWHELPAPVDACSGTLHLAWAGHQRVYTRGPGRTRHQRPFGLALDLRGRLATAAGVAVRGQFRDDRPPLPDGTVLPDEPRSRADVQSLTVELERLSLRGQDMRILQEEWPVLGETLAEIDAKGWVDAVYRSDRDGQDAALASEVTVALDGIELLPDAFRMPTRDVRGTVRSQLVEVTDPEEVELDDEEAVAVSIEGHVLGTWARDVPLSAHVSIPAFGVGRLRARAAGVDPSNPALLGALLIVMDESEGGIAESTGVTDIGLTGRMDFSVDSRLDRDSELSAEDLLRVFLRGNTLASGSVELRELEGVLQHSERVLSSDRIAARIGRTPVVLSGVHLLPAEEVHRFLDDHPLLAREGFLPGNAGTVMLGRLSARDLPIDAEHLGVFVGEDVVERVLEEFEWRGSLDIEDAALYMTGDGRGNAKLGVQGPLVPHDVHLQLGVPLNVISGALDIHALILEAGRARAWVDVRDLFGNVAGRHLDHASMTITYVDGRMTVGGLDAQLEGGTLASLGGPGRGDTALALDLVEPYRFDLGVRLGARVEGESDAEVDRLFGGLFDSSVRDLGRARGELRLSGSPQSLLDLEGEGTIDLVDARLWSVPVARELFRSLGFDATATFDRMAMRFEVADGRVEMTEVRVESPLLHLVGSGSMDLNGELHQRFDVRYSLVEKLGPITMLIYWIQNSLLRVEIRGDMTRPQIFLRNGLTEMFQREARWDRDLPLPDYSRLAPRF